MTATPTFLFWIRHIWHWAYWGIVCTKQRLWLEMSKVSLILKTNNSFIAKFYLYSCERCIKLSMQSSTLFPNKEIIYPWSSNLSCILILSEFSSICLPGDAATPYWNEKYLCSYLENVSVFCKLLSIHQMCNSISCNFVSLAL